MLIGSEVYSIVTYILSENSDDGNSDCCASAVITKMIGHHSRLRDVMGQSYPIYVCTLANHARYSSIHGTICGSSKHSL